MLTLALGAAVQAQTQSVDVPPKRPCTALGSLDAVVTPAFEDLLLADAVVHIRIAENGRSREVGPESFCYTVSEASADVLRLEPLGRSAPRPMATIFVSWHERPFVAGQEYLAFVNYGSPAGVIVHFDNARSVFNDRVQAPSRDELHLRTGMSVDRAFAVLLETYRRYTRFRRYDDQPPRAMDTLSHKTGWVVLGAAERARGVWPEGQPFEFVAADKSSGWLPAPKDRIRLKEDSPVFILDFGARGEALRKRSPANVDRLVYLSDQTGAHAEAGVAYVVADVQFEPADGKLQFVWVRLVAAP